MFAASVQGWLYRHLLKPVFFRQDPEAVHDRMVRVGKALGSNRFARRFLAALFRYRHPILEQDVLGIHFANPVGLAAGFDKDAQLTRVMPSVGFGFEEVGSITGEPCPGNKGKRLWRLPKSRGLVVWYGLKNDGSEAISERLAVERFEIPIGTNVAKTNAPDTVDTEKGIADYEKAFRAFADIGDYFTVNISCPNAFGGEPFSDPEKLDRLMKTLDAVDTDKPVFIKFAADMDTQELDRLIEVADQHRVHGFIFSNLTKKRDRPEIDQAEIAGIDKGGISGKAVVKASNALIGHAYRRAGDRYVIIGLGGIFSAEDAYEKILEGATLVQLITGMIFEGPQLIGEINKGLVALLRRDGYGNIQEAIGARHR